MNGHLKPISIEGKQTLRDLVCESIISGISDGILQPGERIMEIQLSEELGISRTPVREAIRKLEQEGRVVMIPRRGTYVADITLKDITQVYEIRISLDMLAASLAAERITDEEIEEMNRQLLMTGQYAQRGEIDKVVACDSVFHDILYRAARNERLLNIINNLRDQMTTIRSRSLVHPGRLNDTLAEHKALLEAIASRDPETAANAARVHIENAERTLVENFHIGK